MQNHFSRNVAPFVEARLIAARQARATGNTQHEFRHLEQAHVLGQEATYWHVRVHIAMLAWAFRNRLVNEVCGQIFRIVGAATKTAFGLVPHGNTGGSNVSPFKTMPIPAELAMLIDKAKSA